MQSNSIHWYIGSIFFLLFTSSPMFHFARYIPPRLRPRFQHIAKSKKYLLIFEFPYYKFIFKLSQILNQTYLFLIYSMGGTFIKMGSVCIRLPDTHKIRPAIHKISPIMIIPIVFVVSLQRKTLICFM